MIKRGISLLAASVCIFVPLSAQASHTSPADLGHFVDPGDETCFQDAWGAMVNDAAARGRPCPAGARRIVIPLHTYWAGWQEADVSVTARDFSSPVACEMMTARD